MSTSLKPFLSPAFLQHKTIIHHGFFTRQGGCSTGLYHSLNVSFSKKDLPQQTLENRSRVSDYFDQPIEQLCFLKQTHSSTPLLINKPLDKRGLPDADALITTTPGLILGVQTADCVPILLYQSHGPMIAAIHGGWRGLLSGIIENTLKMMQQNSQSPQTIIASIGPCIAQNSYEVSQDVFDGFHEHDVDSEKFFKKGQAEGKYQCDLQGLAEQRLHKAGVNTIDLMNKDTYGNEDLFFSCRRATHKGEKSFGNQASCIMIKENV